MALSKTEIANQSLALVGANRIYNIDDSGDNKARIVKNVFEQSVRQLSEDANWNFLKKRMQLAQLSTTPEFGQWDYQYQLPSDLIRMVSFNLENEYDARDYFQIEGDKLLTNEEYAKIVYVYYEPDSTRYNALYTETLSILIGSKISVQLRQDNSLAGMLYEKYERMLRKARMINGNEDRIRPYNTRKDSAWLNGRYIGTNG